jgi:Flp pilus assembly pilin Flp
MESARNRTSRTERGATSVEYALMVGLLAIGIIASAAALNSKVGGTFGRSAAVLGLGGNAKITNLPFGSPTGQIVVSAGSRVEDWTVETANIDLWSNAIVSSPSGQATIELAGSPGDARIAQEISTVPGQKYRLRYTSRGFYAGTSTMVVTVGAQSRVDSIPTGSPWLDNTFDFTASSGSTRISFESTTGSPCLCNGPGITQVSVELL